MQRTRPVRESTLRIPRASIEEDDSKKRGGSLWTAEEDHKIRKGLRKGLSYQAIHDRYLPMRTPVAIRKRKARMSNA